MRSAFSTILLLALNASAVAAQLGLDPRRLEVPGHKRLEMDFGRPIKEILA